MNLWLLGIVLCLLGGVLAVCGQVLPVVYDYRFQGYKAIRIGVCFWMAGSAILIGSLLLEALA
jgi:hypothetical protein